jgi:hypothetical protein
MRIRSAGHGFMTPRDGSLSEQNQGSPAPEATVSPVAAHDVFVSHASEDAGVAQSVAALDLISMQPSVGTLARNVRLSGVLRVRLGRVRHYLYYRPTPHASQVLLLWHRSRGLDPTT